MKRGPSSSGSKLPEIEGPLQVPGKCQRLSGRTPEGGQVNRPRHTGQMSYARAAQDGLGMAIACGGYLTAQVSKKDFGNTQWVIGGLVDELPEEGFAPRLIDTYWAKGAAILVARTSRPSIGWVVRYQPLKHGRALGSQQWAWRHFLPIKEWWICFWTPWKIRRTIFIDSVG